MKNNPKKALIITYGCRQNTSDSEKIKGVLQSIGYEFCDKQIDSDLIIFNTCAVREGAEDRVYGNIGALKALKLKKPDLVIAICGCMAARSEVADKIKRSFSHVNLVFGTNAIHKLPQMLAQSESGRVFAKEEDEEIYENLSTIHDSKVIANVPIMYGCNNFCTYCIVPYVRGRERSRNAEDIINEVRNLAKNGFKEILLLGQNVNSYSSTIDFPELLLALSEIDGIARIRFLSSHPKDFSPKLITAMSRSSKICKQLHLPFQSGSDKVLEAMNRKYTRAHYIELINMARQAMPNIVISTDTIVGFPSETQADFEETLSLVQELRLDMLFTFIYSKRSGTPAADIPQILSNSQIKENFSRLLKAQEVISIAINKNLISSTQAVLVEGISKNSTSAYTGRTDGGKIVNFTSDNPVNEGDILPIEIINSTPWALGGIYHG
ncbi:tRNA-2-methylthio-N(6)-dimethylallyladenosine synthase [Clostridia bacterium]|nr:tRNA-2-methylthio-N(6)-dimethylallyladenosine synthase [Clostridia bacterium]